MYKKKSCIIGVACATCICRVFTVPYLNSLILQIGLSASTIASSFGKTISENKELGDYRPEDISLSLLRMISYNIGQVGFNDMNCTSDFVGWFD